MTASYVQVWVHYIFSTKHRFGFLEDRATRKEVHRYLGVMVKNLGAPLRIVDGVADHVHILCGQPKTLPIAEFVKELKRTSSIWIKEQFPNLDTFSWQRGYGAFSVSQSALTRVHAYIADQEQHHRSTSFEDEFVKFLKKHRITFKEESIWD